MLFFWILMKIYGFTVYWNKTEIWITCAARCPSTISSHCALWKRNFSLRTRSRQDSSCSEMMSRVASHNFWTSGFRSCIKSIWNKLHRFGLYLISVIPDCPWPRHMSLLNVIQLIFSDLRCIIIRFIIRSDIHIKMAAAPRGPFVTYCAMLKVELQVRSWEGRQGVIP